MKTVLLIEDEAGIIQLIKSILGTDYIVLAHQAGEPALKEMNLITPDIILLDIMLDSGGLSGLDTLSILRNTPALSKVPVVVISGYAAARQIDHALAMGAATFIAKPFSPVHLLAEIEKLIGDK